MSAKKERKFMKNLEMKTDCLPRFGTVFMPKLLHFGLNAAPSWKNCSLGNA